MTSLRHCFKRSVILLERMEGRMLHHKEILKKAAFWRRGKRMLIKFVGDTEVRGAINTAGIET